MGFNTINEWANLSDIQKERNKSTLTVFVYVESAYTGTADYVSVYEVQVKNLIEYRDYAKTSVVTTTSFKYQNLNFPTKVTEIVVV